MSEKNTWSTYDIVENRNNWSLASDGELLKHLQQLSQKLVDKSESTLNLLKSFENEVNQTCTKVSNIDNHFKSLSDTQFIESKVQDSPEIEVNDATHDTTRTSGDRSVKHEDISSKLKEAVENGIKVLDTHYDIIAVTDSDSEDEEPQEILLKARNPYMSRRLPYIIGSEEFTNYDHLGLVCTSSEDEDEEEDEESDEELLPAIVPQSAKIQIESHLAKTEVIRVSSSDSEDGEESTSRNDFAEHYNAGESDKPSINVPQIAPTNPLQARNSFADHLNATLQNYGAKSFRDDAPQVDDIFSPPPFPSKDQVDTSSDDEKSDSSDDVNVRNNPKQTLQNATDADKIDSFSRESPSMAKGQSAKLSSPSLAHESSSSQQPPQLVKSPVSSTHTGPQKQIMKNITDELNAKLKIPPRRVSSSDDSESDLEPISTIASQPKHSSTGLGGKEAKSTDTFARTPSGATESNFDVFATSSVETTIEKPKPKKTLALFDDDDENDDLDDLFKSKKPSNDSKRATKTSLFEDEAKNSQLKEKSTPMLSASVASASTGRKLALFDSDDSDSEDDIFAMINSQRRTNAKWSETKNESKVVEVENETRTASNDDRRNRSGVSKEQSEIRRQVGKDDESRNSTTFDSQNETQAAGSALDDVSERFDDERRQRAETRSRNDDSSAKPVVASATLGVFEENNGITKMSSNDAENDGGVGNETNAVAVAKMTHNEAKISENSISDEKDGNLLVKSEEEKSETTTVECKPKPGKLAIGRGLNINVNALLPGSRWPAKSKENDSVAVDQSQSAETKPVEASAVDLSSENESKSVVQRTTSSITSVMKERAKISTKRRPPTRRARTSKISSEDSFFNDTVAEDDDKKAAESTEKRVNDGTNETNQPLKLAANIDEPDRSKVDGREERKKTNIDKLFQSDDEESDDEREKVEKIDESVSLPPSKSASTESTASILPSTTNGAKRPPLNGNSASVLTGFIKDRNQLSQKQTPSRVVDVAESNLEDDIPSIKSTDVDTKAIEPVVESTNTVDDIFSPENVANPASTSKKVDFAKLFGDSDEEDDLLADVFAKSKSFQDRIQPKIPCAEEKSSVAVENVVTKTHLTDDPIVEPVSNVVNEAPVVAPESEEPAQSSSSVSHDARAKSPVVAKVETVATKRQSAGSGVKHSKDLFDDDDDDDMDSLFAKSPVNAASSLFAVKPTKKVEVGKKPTSSAKSNDSKKIDLFADDDDDLFSASKKAFSSKNAPKKGSLFDDDDDDDDDLFGSKKTRPVNKSSSLSK